jgi:hypothetical protein
MTPERFTEKFQQALEAALANAARRRHTEVDNEHLLEALLDQPEGVAKPLLEHAGVSLPALQQKLSAAVKEWATKGWLIGPLPYEKKPAPLPDLSARNELLKRYQSVIETVAKANGLGFIDLLSAWPKDAAGWTRDGVQLTDAGTQLVAKLMAQQLSGVAPPAEINPKLLKLIREKNLLWHDYWRPTNWAFLYGDRTVQPSSRDHMNPNVRWFPQELENYRALIAAKENEMMKEQDANGRKLP